MEITILVLAAITVGLVEIAKGLITNAKIIPVVALFIGVIIMIIGGEIIEVTGLRQQILTGLVLGLSAVGLYSAGKTLAE